MKAVLITVLSLITLLTTGNCAPVQHSDDDETVQQSKQGSPPEVKPTEKFIEPTAFPRVIQDDVKNQKEVLNPTGVLSPPSIEDLTSLQRNGELSSAELDGASADLIFKTIISLFKDDPSLLEGIIQEMKNEERDLQKLYDEVTRDQPNTQSEHVVESIEEDKRQDHSENEDGNDEVDEIARERQRLQRQFHRVYIPTDEDSQGNPIYTAVAYDPEPMPNRPLAPPSGDIKPDYVEGAIKEYNDHKLKDEEIDEDKDDDEEDEDDEDSESNEKSSSQPNHYQSGILYDSKNDRRGSMQVEKSRDVYDNDGLGVDAKRAAQKQTDKVANQLTKLHRP